jgi:hypothetical protein
MRSSTIIFADEVTMLAEFHKTQHPGMSTVDSGQACDFCQHLPVIRLAGVEVGLGKHERVVHHLAQLHQQVHQLVLASVPATTRGSLPRGPRSRSTLGRLGAGSLEHELLSAPR